MTMTPITFGTSGWRGLIGDDFTFPRARAVVQGIADHVTGAGLAERGLVVGYDTRFLSERVAEEAARVLAANGIPIFLCERDTPTPVVAHEILRRHTAGAVTVTASHNPPEWNGIKFSTATGGPALPDMTRFIAEQANTRWLRAEVPTMEIAAAEKDGLLVRIDPISPYLAHLSKLVETDVIRRAGLTVVVDVLYGTGRGVLDEACRNAGCAVEVLHDWRDAYFGGGPPDPSPSRLAELAARVRARQAHIGLATDGDADRFGIVDRDGTVMSANQILALICKHLLATRPAPGGVARTVATTHLLDAIARRYNVPCYETRVGFKYLGELISQGKVLVAGEESAGLSIGGHVPEKDGILACLLVAELVAHAKGASLRALVDQLHTEVGAWYSQRIDLSVTPAERDRLLERLAEPPAQFLGRRVARVGRLDGTQLVLEDGSWILVRPSGTEPVVRLYAEAQSRRDLEQLVDAARELVIGSPGPAAHRA